jgi:hypothetical protein
VLVVPEGMNGRVLSFEMANRQMRDDLTTYRLEPERLQAWRDVRLEPAPVHGTGSGVDADIVMAWAGKLSEEVWQVGGKRWLRGHWIIS